MNANVVWQEGLKFNGTADSGFTVPLDSGFLSGGESEGFKPMELIATGLAGCTAMDTISILQKKRQEITAFEVNVDAEQAKQHPHVFTHIRIEYLITGHAVDEKAVLRAIQLSAERYCPAQGMLSQVVPMKLEYQIFEDHGDLERELITIGAYTREEI
ncbi:MAG: OsmC family protein [Anaerolineales bacterium]|jgi:putative redox protein